MKLRVHILVLATLVFVMCFTARGQKVHFTDTSNVWKVVQPVYVGTWSGVAWLFNYSSYSFRGRNIIDSFEYVNFGFGLVREDIVAKKIYLSRGGTDVVLIDYNLNVVQKANRCIDKILLINRHYKLVSSNLS